MLGLAVLGAVPEPLLSGNRNEGFSNVEGRDVVHLAIGGGRVS